MIDRIPIAGRILCRIDATAPWGLAGDPLQVATFHAMIKGEGVLRVDGVPGETHITTGDVVVLTRGTGHSIVDDLSTRAQTFGVAFPGVDLSTPQRLQLGPFGPKRAGSAVILCGAFHGDRGDRPPILGLLPEILHVRGDSGRFAPDVRGVIEMILAEISGSAMGAASVIERLSSVLFVRLLRRFAASGPAPHWVRALGDQQIVEALTLIHDTPQSPWTVDLLARRVGLSRSGFSARFTSLVQESPMSYLNQVRMQHAAGRLRAGSENVAEIAQSLGYESEASLSRAFKRRFGVPPGAYRRGAA
jgi:AraC-like DNA-binding protein